MKTAALVFAASLSVPTLAFAQKAEGSYPGTLFCEAGAGMAAAKVAVTVEILDGRATYAFRTGAGTETGGGTMAGRQLVMTGRSGGRGAYEARYAGEVSGQGGLLTGTQTGRGFRRACQISLGNGRG